VYGAQAVYIGSGARLRGRLWCLRVSSSSVNKEGKCVETYSDQRGRRRRMNNMFATGLNEE
jgi:hypothetical protein